jgi:hypothetical protein
MKLRSPTCLWCSTEFSTPDLLRAHLVTCQVRKAVQDAEARAGVMMDHNDIRAVRDRARKELGIR